MDVSGIIISILHFRIESVIYQQVINLNEMSLFIRKFESDMSKITSNN
jgi:hypothetical protein